MSTPFFPQGTRLKRRNPGTGVYENVPQVLVTSFGSVTTEFDDITNHDSVSGYREKAATVKDPGSIPCQLVFNPADAMHQQLFTDNKNGTKLTWRVVLPDANGVVDAGAMTQFDAYVTGLDNPAEVARAMRLDFSLERTGAPTFTW
jgi:predicted secreted protein